MSASPLFAQGFVLARGDFDITVAVALAILGLAVGSFLNVCIHRIPRRASIVSPGSSCPHCGYVLRWYDNIPVVSYALLLGGRCRQCKASISIRYPIIEVITMIVFVLHYVILGLDIILIPRLLFATALIVLFAIDLEHHLLPDVITLPGIVVGLAFSVLTPPGIVDALIGTVAGGGVLWLLGEAYYRYSGQEGMGGGDVKMLAMIGAFLGWKLMLLTLILSSFLGALVGGLMLAIGKGGLKSALPYGTFLAVGALFSSLVGDPLVAWYLGFYQ
jgi:leader peptidase (prepilin peptidase)/N-methyltransferase